MLTAGDEVLRTQRGNNNAYCQDNDVSWLDWSFAPGGTRDAALHARADRAAQAAPSLRRTRFLNGHADERPAEIHWYGETLGRPAWQDPDARVLCFTLAGVTPQEPALHVMINMASTRAQSAAARRGGAQLAPHRRHDARSRPTTSCLQGSPCAAHTISSAPHGIAVFEDSAVVLQSGA